MAALDIAIHGLLLKVDDYVTFLCKYFELYLPVEMSYLKSRRTFQESSQNWAADQNQNLQCCHD